MSRILCRSAGGRASYCLRRSRTLSRSSAESCSQRGLVSLPASTRAGCSAVITAAENGSVVGHAIRCTPSSSAPLQSRTGFITRSRLSLTIAAETLLAEPVIKIEVLINLEIFRHQRVAGWKAFGAGSNFRPDQHQCQERGEGNSGK